MIEFVITRYNLLWVLKPLSNIRVPAHIETKNLKKSMFGYMQVSTLLRLHIQRLTFRKHLCLPYENSYLCSRHRRNDRQVSNCKAISCYEILVLQKLIQEFIRFLNFLHLLWISGSFSKDDRVLKKIPKKTWIFWSSSLCTVLKCDYFQLMLVKQHCILWRANNCSTLQHKGWSTNLITTSTSEQV